MTSRLLTPARAQLAMAVFALLTLSVLILFALSVAGLTSESGGKPLALDFDPYWSAAKLTLSGHARDAYDNKIIEAFERAHTRLTAPGYLAFYYPPPYLLLCLPLGLLPYVPALLLWVAAQAALLWTILRRILTPRWALLPVLAYPGFVMNVFSGQNAGFTASCFAGALLLLERRPALAGACLGFLVCKPQIALAVPVALFAARRWRAAAAAAGTAAGLCALSWLLLGNGPWAGFLANAPAARSDLELLSMKWPMMQSAYAQVRLAGFSLAFGYCGQALVAAASLSVLVVVCWRRLGAGAEMAALSLTALLVTPFLYDYDLMIAAPALAWLTAQGVASGFRRGEAAWLKLIYILPFIAVAAGRFAEIPLAPPALFITLLLIPFGTRKVKTGVWGGGTPPQPSL